MRLWTQPKSRQHMIHKKTLIDDDEFVGATQIEDGDAVEATQLDGEAVGAI